MNIKSSGRGRVELAPGKQRLGNVNPGILVDEAITVAQAISNSFNKIDNGTNTFNGVNTFAKNIVMNRTPVAINTTAAGTLSVVTSGLVAGAISSTSAAAVLITLDSVANIITAFAVAGVALTTNSLIQFNVNNSQGANTVTIAVDAGTTIAVATPAITGGSTLTVSTANKVATFQLYLTSNTTAILSRVL